MDELMEMVKEYGRLCADELPESAERELAAIKEKLVTLLEAPEYPVVDGVCTACGQMDAGTL